MKPRLAKTGILLLVMVIAMVGLTSCERKAEPRETEATEAVEASQTSGVVSGADTPAPGETIVSAVTPAPQGTEAADQPTASAPAGGTPEAAVPTATTAVGGETTEQPTAEPAPTQQVPEGPGVYHVVQRGETLFSIATRYGTTVDVIVQANNLANPQMIYVGQKLLIPTSEGAAPPAAQPPSTGCRIKHTVKAGEWVWQIARDYGVSPYDVLAANGLTIHTGRTIQPGTVLCIP